MNYFRPLIALSIAAVVGCAQDAEGPASETVDVLGPGEVALVDGERIAESVFRLFTLGALQASADDLTPEGRQEVIERLINVTLLANEAERTGLDKERRVAAELELQRIQLLARHMADRFTEENPPREAELRDLYQENLDRLRVAEYETRHILVETEAEAASLIAELDEGADFIELAREHSIGPTAPDGGSLGRITVDSVVEPFAQAVQAATPGVHYPTPVRSQYGWHVILVEEKEEGVAPGLEAIREDLVVAVETKKLSDFAASLREAAEVTILE